MIARWLSHIDYTEHALIWLHTDSVATIDVAHAPRLASDPQIHCKPIAEVKEFNVAMAGTSDQPQYLKRVLVLDPQKHVAAIFDRSEPEPEPASEFSGH